MYEDEEGRWQDRVDALWIAIDDRERLVGSRSVALLGKVAEVVTLGLDRVFGAKLFSVRMLGVSTSLSSGTVSLLALVEALIERHPVDVTRASLWLSFVLAAMLPAIVFKQRWWSGLSLLPLIVLLLFFAPIVRPRPEYPAIPFAVGAGYGIASDILTTISIRRLVCRITRSTRALPILAAMLSQLACGLLVVLVPVFILRGLGFHHGAHLSAAVTVILGIQISPPAFSVSAWLRCSQAC